MYKNITYNFSEKIRLYCLFVNDKSYDQLTVADFLSAFSLNEKYLIDDETLSYFFEHEHLIVKTDCFWWVSSFVWVMHGSWYDKWQTTFLRYDRLDTSFSKRLRWCNPTPIDSHLVGQVATFPTTDDRDTFSDYFAEKPNDEPFRVYRGFRVRHGEVVRTNVKKLDNPEAHIQVEGKGPSHTLNPVFAVGHLNTTQNPYFLKKYANIAGSKQTKQFLAKKYFGMLPTWQGDTILTYAYSCIGTYEVSKKDIIFVKTGIYEEVIFDSNSVKLVRYDFISWVQSYAALLCRQFLYEIQDRHSVYLRHIVLDMWSLIDIYKKWASLASQNPTILTSQYGKSKTNITDDLRLEDRKLTDTIYSNLQENSKKFSDDGYDWDKCESVFADALLGKLKTKPNKVVSDTGGTSEPPLKKTIFDI